MAWGCCKSTFHFFSLLILILYVPCMLPKQLTKFTILSNFLSPSLFTNCSNKGFVTITFLVCVAHLCCVKIRALRESILSHFLFKLLHTIFYIWNILFLQEICANLKWMYSLILMLCLLRNQQYKNSIAIDEGINFSCFFLVFLIHGAWPLLYYSRVN